jgi:hypothetical protein
MGAVSGIEEVREHLELQAVLAEAIERGPTASA